MPQGDLNPEEKKYAVIAGSGTNPVELVAAVTGRKIRVLSYVLSVSAATTITFDSGTDDITGTIHFVGAALVPFASGYNPAGHFETAAAAALQMTSSGDVSFDGHLTYIEV